MLSAVVLTHNDENSIGKTLESIKWVDEIIIIDDQSDDDTLGIAHRYTDKIFNRPLDGDFSSQRNYGLKKSAGDWILCVDSDEVVNQDLRHEIQDALTNPDAVDIKGFYFKRTDYFLGRKLKYGETAGVRLLRLAHKGSGLWERPVHEVWNITGRTDILKNPLIHMSHNNLAGFIEKINRYSTINANYLYETGKKIYVSDLICYPAGKFFRNYVLKLGFLDGVYGFVMAMMMSLHSFLTRSKLFMLYDKKA